MRHNISMILLSAGIVLSLAGCRKDVPKIQSTTAVRFSTSPAGAETRTSFSGKGTQDGEKKDELNRNLLSWERIDWVKGDQVMIASDHATIYDNPDKKVATYTVYSVTEDGDLSHATLEEKNASEELFFNDQFTSYDFWGVYPASVGDETSLQNDKTVNYSIDVEQGVESKVDENITVGNETFKLTTLKPKMDKAVMLAYAKEQSASEVDLQFYPAFSAFEVQLRAEPGSSDFNLSSVTLHSEKSYLSGEITVTINPVDADTEFVLTTDETKKSHDVTLPFPTGTKISPNQYLNFTVLTLPLDVDGLSLTFNFKEGGSTTARLSKKVGETKEDIKFTGRKKHRLFGLMMKGGTLLIQPEVAPWESGSENSFTTIENIEMSFLSARRFDTDGDYSPTSWDIPGTYLAIAYGFEGKITIEQEDGTPVEVETKRPLYSPLFTLKTIAVGKALVIKSSNPIIKFVVPPTSGLVYDDPVDSITIPASTDESDMKQTDFFIVAATEGQETQTADITVVIADSNTPTAFTHQDLPGTYDHSKMPVYVVTTAQYTSDATIEITPGI